MNAFGLARVGRDTETRITGQGESVANVSLAFSWGRRDEATGKRQTVWVDGTLWGKRAEVLAPMLLKGTPCVVMLEDLHLETFTSRDGQENTKLVGRIIDVDLMGTREQGERAAPAPAPRPAPAPARGRAPAPPVDDFGDQDIPF